METPLVPLLVFACVCGSAALGLWLVLPEHHLNSGTQDVVRTGTGFVGTIAALVLGLLVSSAQTSFDRVNDELLQDAAGVLMLDRALAEYGEDARGARDLLKSSYTKRIEMRFSASRGKQARVDGRHAVTHDQILDTKIRQLAAADRFHEGLQERALDVLAELQTRRALIHAQGKQTIPEALLVILVLWLAVIFATFGLFAPRNATVWIALMTCAVSAASAVFLIQELNTPFSGFVAVSPTPMQETIEHLGQ